MLNWYSATSVLLLIVDSPRNGVKSNTIESVRVYCLKNLLVLSTLSDSSHESVKDLVLVILTAVNSSMQSRYILATAD